MEKEKIFRLLTALMASGYDNSLWDVICDCQDLRGYLGVSVADNTPLEGLWLVTWAPLERVEVDLNLWQIDGTLINLYRLMP